MKEELFEAMEDVDPESVSKAREYHAKLPAWRKLTAVAACAALIIGVIFGIPALRKGSAYPAGVNAVLAAYPKPVSEHMSAGKFMESYSHWDWWDSYRKQASVSERLQPGLEGYYSDMMRQLLISEDENTVCSPINTYIAFAMLAEVSQGNTRQQILDMLGASDMEKLRSGVSSLWESNYVDTPVLKSNLANSLWLNGSIEYNKGTLDRLAEDYHASTFSGTPGSAEMDKALRKWTNDNTGGLLKEYTKDMSLSPDTVLEILSTIYYKAMWVDEFVERANTREAFHGTKGDTTVDMMHRYDMMGVYRTDAFTSVGLSLNDSGAMYFFLPGENTDVNALLTDRDIMKAIRNGSDDNRFYPRVNLSVPKFRVSGKVDLLEAVRRLGVTDALDYTKADFSPLTTERNNIFLSKAEHAAMIEIDEHGVTGAAYTELAVTEGALEPPDEQIDFVLDRPFMFIVTGRDGSVLFSGIVRNID